ncbi:MAG: hypothetical protein RLZZ458_766 [Planctomycetota bacterium]
MIWNKSIRENCGRNHLNSVYPKRKAPQPSQLTTFDNVLMYWSDGTQSLACSALSDISIQILSLRAARRHHAFQWNVLPQPGTVTVTSVHACRGALWAKSFTCRTEPTMGATHSSGVPHPAHNKGAEPSGWNHPQSLCGTRPQGFRNDFATCHYRDLLAGQLTSLASAWNTRLIFRADPWSRGKRKNVSSSVCFRSVFKRSA